MRKSSLAITFIFSFFLQKSESITSLVNLSYNHLYEAPLGLKKIVNKLIIEKNIHLLHIGDSHVQIGELSNGLKLALDEKGVEIENGWFLPSGIFNNLYHPYLTVTKQSKPFEYHDVRNDSTKQNLGITGRTFSLYAKHNRVHFKSKIPVSKLEFFHANDSNLILKTIKSSKQVTEILSSKYAKTTIIFAKPLTKFKIDFHNKSTHKIAFYSLRMNHSELKNTYSKFGVSGAKFSDFFQSTELFEQIKVLNPHLLVVTLGTNDSYFSALDTNSFEHQLQTFIQKTKQINPELEFIFMTSPDTKYKGSKPEKLTFVNEVIKKTCRENHIAYWDWYEIMGGENAIDKWEAAGFSSGDYLHFSTQGYQALGKYFGEALIELSN